MSLLEEKTHLTAEDKQNVENRPIDRLVPMIGHPLALFLVNEILLKVEYHRVLGSNRWCKVELNFMVHGEKMCWKCLLIKD